MRRLAKVYEGGAEKYAARNWEKGTELGRFLDSAKRHINDLEYINLYKREGIPLEELPPDINPNEDHAAQAIWNLFAYIHMEEIHPEFDNLTTNEQPATPDAPAAEEPSTANLLTKFFRNKAA